MGWKIPEIKIRMPEVRVPKTPAGRAMPKPRVKKPASGKIDGFSLTVFSSNKPKGIKQIDVIRALIETNGNRRGAAEKVGIYHSVVIHHAKKIRRLPEAELQIYANELGTTVSEIKRVCADLTRSKQITQIDVIRALIETNGNRRGAAKKLGINHGNVSQRARKTKNLPEAKLADYAKVLGTTIAEIKRVCVDFDNAKIPYIDIIKTLVLTNGNRRGAAKKLGMSAANISQRAKKIRHLSDGQLQKYAGKLKITIDKIKQVCAGLGPTKGITHIEIIETLLKTNGNRTKAAKKLKKSGSGISRDVENIRSLSDNKLAQYARKLGVNVDEIKRVCVDLGSTKGITHIDIIEALLKTDGNRTAAAEKLKISTGLVSLQAKNIRYLPEAELVKYANELSEKLSEKITVRSIRDVVSPRIKGKINFGRRLQIIRALIEAYGNRTDASKKLGINNGIVSRHAKNIRRLPEADLAQYAAELGVSVKRIKQVCAPRLEQAKKLFGK